MSDEIFPKNWDAREKRKKEWKKPETQENICPVCNCYTGRFKHDGACQFCGFKQKPKMSDEGKERIIEKCLEAIEYVGRYNSREREAEAKTMVREALEGIQQKPEIDKKYVEEKARGMYQTSFTFRHSTPENNLRKCEKFITQIIREVRG